MLLLLWILPSVLAQNPYGPSQLDQYARLINSGNLGGFGFLQNAITQGTIRGLGDLNPPPILAGLPPLPLTHEEMMKRMTSTTPTPPTRPTAKPTTPSTNPGGIYAMNTLVELPPMPENRIHGTFDEDGVFHPDNEGKTEEEAQIARNQIQGTKIRDISQAERDAVDGHTEENSSKDDEDEEDTSLEDPLIRPSANAGAHRLAHHSEKSSHKPRQHAALPRRQIIRRRHIRRQQHDQPVNPARGQRQAVAQQQQRYPPFIFRPKPPPPQREPEYNNLLAEIEEYDDFLEQQRLYLSHYPKANLQNPYQDLPPGQLPAAGSYSAGQFNAPANIQPQELPGPRRNLNQGPENFRPPPPPQQPQVPQQPQQPQQPWPQPQPQPQQPNFFPQPFPPPPPVPPAGGSTENPLLKIFSLFSIPHHHAHALAAPQVSLDDDPTTTTTTTTSSTPLPRPNPYQLGMLPIPPSAMPLVDIHQQPLQPLSFPQVGSPLVLQPLFHGK
ncbi:hypothetical protein V3C99_017554 [Haemonchus contortus]